MTLPFILFAIEVSVNVGLGEAVSEKRIMIQQQVARVLKTIHFRQSRLSYHDNPNMASTLVCS